MATRTISISGEFPGFHGLSSQFKTLNSTKFGHPLFNFSLNSLVSQIVRESHRAPVLLRLQINEDRIEEFEFRFANAFSVRKFLGAMITGGKLPQINIGQGIELVSSNAMEEAIAPTSSPLIAIDTPYKELLERFLAEQDNENKLLLLDKIFDIANNGGDYEDIFIPEETARGVLADNLVNFFESLIVLMRLQKKDVQDHYYELFYAISRNILEKEYKKRQVNEGVTIRKTKFWTVLITLSRLNKIRTFFNSDIILMHEKADAYRKIREGEKNRDVVRVKEIIWSLINEEINLLNYGIEEETIPVNKNEIWTSEAGVRLNQSLALLWPSENSIRSRYYNRIFSLRKALEYAGHLPDINLNMEDQEIKGDVNIVFFYERWSGDLIAKLKNVIRNESVNIILAPSYIKDIILREKDGVTTAHLLSGLLFNKDGRLTLARFSHPLEIHYVYRILKNPYASNISGLGVPIAVDYPFGNIYTRKTDTSRLLSDHQEETGVKIPGFIEFKRDSLKDTDLGSFGSLLSEHFPPDSIKRLVIKPVVGMGGKGIQIINRQNVKQIYRYARYLSSRQDIMIEEGIETAEVSIEGENFDSTLRFHIVRDVKGNPIIHRGFCRIGKGIVNVNLLEGAKKIRMKDLFRHMVDLHLSEDDIEKLLVKAEQSALKISTILEHANADDEGNIVVTLEGKSHTQFDYVVVDLFFDGTDFFLNEINLGNVGGDIGFDMLYPDRRGILTNAICERLIYRASAYYREIRKRRRWHWAGAHTAGTEVELDLTMIAKNGHRRPMTYSEASKAMESVPLPDSSIYIDGFGGIESITGHISVYDVKGETNKFAEICRAIIRYLKKVIDNKREACENDKILISCTGQYGSGVHLNIRRPSYGEEQGPNDDAVKDYHRIKAIIPLISALSTNPSEGFWHPLSRKLKNRQTTEFFDIRRYGDVVYNITGSEKGMPPRIEIRPPDTPLHSAYIGLYYAIIYAALAGKIPEKLSFEGYHKAFCNGAMQNMRGMVPYNGEKMTFREALNRFYESNREIFEELELSDAQQEVLDAARLNGFTYKDFNDSLGRILDEDIYLKMVVEIFEKSCRNPEQKLSDIIKETSNELKDALDISPQKIEAINALVSFFTYRPADLNLTEDPSQLFDAEKIEQDDKLILKIEREQAPICSVTLSKINGSGIIEFTGIADRISTGILINKAMFYARTKRLRSVETYLKAGQVEDMQFLLNHGFMFKRVISERNGEVIFIMSKQLDYSEPLCFQISELPHTEEVIENVQEGLGKKIEEIAEKPLLLILIPEKGKPGMSMRAVATYIEFAEERNRELGMPFDIKILDEKDVKNLDDDSIERISERIKKANGVIFNRANTGQMPQQILDLLDEHGINSLGFERATNSMAHLLERIQENPELSEYIPQAKYHVTKESLPGVLNEILKESESVLIIDENRFLSEPVEVRSDMTPDALVKVLSQLGKKGEYTVQRKVEPLRTIGGKVFIIDAVVQKDHLGKLKVVQRIVRIPKKIRESRVHVGVTPGYTGLQTIIKELWDDGIITEELITKMDSMLIKLAEYLEESFGSAGNFNCKLLIGKDGKIYITFISDRPFQAPVGITPIVQERIEQTMRITDQALWRHVEMTTQ